jgi:hypothetical protein
MHPQFDVAYFAQLEWAVAQAARSLLEVYTGHRRDDSNHYVVARKKLVVVESGIEIVKEVEGTVFTALAEYNLRRGTGAVHRLFTIHEDCGAHEINIAKVSEGI